MTGKKASLHSLPRVRLKNVIRRNLIKPGFKAAVIGRAFPGEPKAKCGVSMKYGFSSFFIIVKRPHEAGSGSTASISPHERNSVYLLANQKS
ncbi:MAG: hypothetical protein LBU32_31040 [Clostridiales bacterium]|nr:hypothetical protein [Clostridiales bacterium]